LLVDDSDDDSVEDIVNADTGCQLDVTRLTASNDTTVVTTPECDEPILPCQVQSFSDSERNISTCQGSVNEQTADKSIVQLAEESQQGVVQQIIGATNNKTLTMTKGQIIAEYQKNWADHFSDQLVGDSTRQEVVTATDVSCVSNVSGEEITVCDVPDYVTDVYDTPPPVEPSLNLPDTVTDVKLYRTPLEPSPINTNSPDAEPVTELATNSSVTSSKQNDQVDSRPDTVLSWAEPAPTTARNQAKCTIKFGNSIMFDLDVE
jgi:hypothetical protein